MSSLFNSSGDEDLNEKILKYLEFAKDLETATDVKDLVQRGEYNELKNILTTRLTFGTAGLRGRMGPGYAAMNDLVIIQTSQGLAAYLETCTQDSFSSKKVAIGFDNRHNSQRFSQLAAISFLLKGFKVYLFSIMIPTPFIPFTVKQLGCCAGIMITASHNPKDDNGYKVYWSNGAQILPPHDTNIQDCILQNLNPWPGALDTSLVWTSPLCSDPYFDIPMSYFKILQENCCMDEIPASSYANLKITFTSMHGVSHTFMKKAFEMLKFENYVPVKEQMYPDPFFPTVIFPNPEEKNSLDLSIKTAEANGSRLILANDPDADRLAMAEKLNNDSWHIFSGNEVGALLGYWLWKTLKPEYKSTPENCCMISSTVSSKILRSISKAEGFKFYETLTGFKWMANKADEAIKKDLTFLFAFEEAIGYMCGSAVLDKDGINAAIQMTKMAAYAYSNGRIVYDILNDVYEKYGYHVNCNSYFICKNPDSIQSMFDRLRNYDGVENKYPGFLPYSKPFIVTGVRDLTTGYDSTQTDKKAILPCSSSTQMITFYFENGCEATLRTSGTEPKVKYYTEMIAKVSKDKYSEISALLKQMVNLIITYWMEPEKNGFQDRPT